MQIQGGSNWYKRGDWTFFDCCNLQEMKELLCNVRLDSTTYHLNKDLMKFWDPNGGVSGVKPSVLDFINDTYTKLSTSF